MPKVCLCIEGIECVSVCMFQEEIEYSLDVTFVVVKSYVL